MKTSTSCLNEIEVTYARKEVSPTAIIDIAHAGMIVSDVFKKSKCQLEYKEYFFIILVNRANKVIGYHKLSEGGLSGTIADIKLAFAIALKSLASAMILAHNHPSGTLLPSQADIDLTNQFAEAGKILNLKILDHIIITSEGYFSFAAKHMLR